MPLLDGSWNGSDNWKPWSMHWDNPDNVPWDKPAASPALSDPLAAKQTATMNSAKMVSKLGLFTAVMGSVTSAIGGFYAAKTAQYQQKSAASSYQFQSDMAAINARSAETDAQSILEAGKSEIANYTMRAGQEKAATTASTASRGVVLGVGSARDVAASQDLVKDIDVMTINSNATRAAWAARTRGTNYSNQALLDRTSSANAMRSAGSISPFASLSTSLLGSASMIGTQWLAGRDTRD